MQDVAGAIQKCLDDDTTIGQTYELAGPQVFTLRQLVQAAGRCAGHARPVIGLPDSLGRLQAWAMEMLPGAPLMSRDNLASMRVPNVASGTLPGLAHQRQRPRHRRRFLLNRRCPRHSEAPRNANQPPRGRRLA